MERTPSNAPSSSAEHHSRGGHSASTRTSAGTLQNAPKPISYPRGPGLTLRTATHNGRKHNSPKTPTTREAPRTTRGRIPRKRHPRPFRFSGLTPTRKVPCMNSRPPPPPPRKCPAGRGSPTRRTRRKHNPPACRRVPASAGHSRRQPPRLSRASDKSRCRNRPAVSPPCMSRPAMSRSRSRSVPSRSPDTFIASISYLAAAGTWQAKPPGRLPGQD